MEVRDEAIDDAKAIARRDEEIGLAAPGGDVAVARGRLERSQARGPDRDHARPTLMRALDGGCGRRRELVSLAVHAVVGEALRTHGLKGAGPDVQGEEGELDAVTPERSEQRLVEVQPGGRRGDRTGRARIDGLITPLVYGIGQVSDIRWERYAAVTLEQFEHGRIACETQAEEIVGSAEDDGVECAGEPQPHAGARRMARPDLGQRLARPRYPFDQHLDAPAGIPDPGESGLDDTCVVQDEQIPGREQSRQ